MANGARKITVQDYYGYELPMNERYRLIRDAGFDGVMLGWCGFPDNPHETKHLNPDFARKNDLYLENLHTPFVGCNNLWLEGIGGDEYLNAQLSCLDDCVSHDIPAMVIHVSSGDCPPPVGSTGLERIKRLVCKAEDNGINLAFENLRCSGPVRFLFSHLQSERVKFCFDIGHWHWRTPDQDLLSEFGGKLSALHLHDNDGTGDQHLLPFEGTLDWDKAMLQINKTGYCGAIGLEVGNSRFEVMPPLDFLRLACERAIKLQMMLDSVSVSDHD